MSQVFIYSRYGHHLSTINTPDNDTLRDSSWTPLGNIIYTTFSSSKLVVMSESGYVIISHTQVKFPTYFWISNDIIYLPSLSSGVYQSTNDGVNWSLAFSKAPDQWYCFMVIKVTTDQSDDFWTLEKSSTKETYHLRVYSVHKRPSISKVTWKELSFTTNNGFATEFENSAVLSYDGNMNIFLSIWEQKTVYVLSVNGQYQCTLLSSSNITEHPCRLAVDKDRQLLYVGQTNNLVGVYRFA